MLRNAAVAATLIWSAGCGRPEPAQVAVTSPNPSGCYMQLFDMGRFAGTSEFLNGPIRAANLNALPSGARWANRIRSVRMGSIATAVAWRDTDFKGRSTQLDADRTYPTLEPGFDGEIRSLAIACSTSD